MIKFDANNLQLETGQGIYDHEENGVTTIINFSYDIRYYEDYNNSCKLDIDITDSRQWMNEGTFDKPIKLMPSENMIFKEMVTDAFNEAPCDYGLAEFLEEELEF